MECQPGKKEDIKKIPTKVLTKAIRQRMSGKDPWYGTSCDRLVPADPVTFVYEHKEYSISRTELLKILSTREHVPNKQEAKKIRQQKAKHGN